MGVVCGRSLYSPVQAVLTSAPKMASALPVVDIRWIGGPGDGEIEPVDREHIADAVACSLLSIF